jgi:hypothetical protein
MTGSLVARLTNLGDLTDTLLIVSFPVLFTLAILRPMVIARWAKRAYPDLPEDHPSLLSTVRFIGIMGLGVMAAFLLILVFSH